MSAIDHPTPAHEIRERFGFWKRSYAMLIKEFIQLRRDRVSFAMIVMLPVMQLVLFGYAINTTPHNLPSAVLLQEESDLARSIRELGKEPDLFYQGRVSRAIAARLESEGFLTADDLALAQAALLGTSGCSSS